MIRSISRKIRLITFIYCLLRMVNAYILLYDTEGNDTSQRSYCIFWEADLVMKYCIANSTVQTGILNVTARGDCFNQGRKWLFRDMLAQNISPTEVVRWSSSVESADNYAAFFYGDRSAADDDRFLCECRVSGTFGSRCDFELFDMTTTFGSAMRAQFKEKETDNLAMQRHGDILCYQTIFECDYGLLCLDWRDICDGQQQCMDGTDEENCHLLEFNECDDDEYRCVNGMCITEEFWLDGDFDCMDRSDEKWSTDGASCAFTPGSLDCEEGLCSRQQWSCGDGQCIDGAYRLGYKKGNEGYCVNLRELNYICEMHPSLSFWTQPNGLCSDEEDYDDALDMNNANLNNASKCVYLIRCALSGGFERDCPCDGRNCISLMRTVCEVGSSYRYPSGGIIRPYIYLFYDWDRPWTILEPLRINFEGSLKCRGFHGKIESAKPLYLNDWHKLSYFPAIDFLFCHHDDVVRDDQSSRQYHPACWAHCSTFNNQSYAFLDFCHRTQECLSQYRMNDGYDDCGEEQQATVTSTEACSKLRKHRFHCSDQQPSCLPVRTLGDHWADCENERDEFVNGADVPLSRVACRHRNDMGCRWLKDYVIHESGTDMTSTITETVVPERGLSFRSYCDTFWNLPLHLDESSQHCRRWICLPHQYQCRTGQCIEFKWLCDGEWDCPDASDEQAVHLNLERLHHNAELVDFNNQVSECESRYSTEPAFVDFCNVTTELPCLLANVTNPLNFTVNRPCIELSEIGDGVSNCYGGFDEKNTLESCDGSMLGFTFRCSNEQCFDYDSLCYGESHSCKDEILCHHKRDKGTCSGRMDVTCLDGKCIHDGRCDRHEDCPDSEDEYWCPPIEAIGNQKYKYRRQKETMRLYNDLRWPEFPSNTWSNSLKRNDRNQLTRSIVALASAINFTRVRSNGSHSFVCNRGVAVQHARWKDPTCFCPPSYYGRWCEYFTDRLTMIVHFNLTAWSGIRTQWFTIVASLLYLDRIIDSHQFESDVSTELQNYIKHRFYLLYPSSVEVRAQKLQRHFNRTDVISHHPYSVRLTMYALTSNHVTELGTWLYPVYFDFLPSSRLARVLSFPAWFGNSSIDPCANDTSCPPNSVCRPIFDQKRPRLWCSCLSGYYGKRCESFESSCPLYCSADALCKPMGRGELSGGERPLCICPLHRYGPRCYLRRGECHSQPCRNNGTCLVRYDPSGQRPFTCNCTANFHGEYCDQQKFSVRINLNMTAEAVVSVIQLYDVHSSSHQLLLRQQLLISGLPNTIQLHHSMTPAPALGVLKMYNHSTAFNYYVVYIQEDQVSIDVNSTPAYCRQVGRNETGVFEYHQLCRNDDALFCFHDDLYLCICEENHTRVDCFSLDPSADQCQLCFFAGMCLRGDLSDADNFVCFCPKCSHGRRCEFTSYAFGFTLDSLLAGDPLFVQIIYTCFVALLVGIGLFTNICSWLTFRRPQVRAVTVGNYLYFTSILNQCALLFLLGKFVHILGAFVWQEQVNRLACKAVAYLLILSTRTTFWLTSWITCDRLQTIVFPTSTLFKRPNIAKGLSVVTLVGLAAMHMPDLLYTTLAADTCIANFDHPRVSLYNRLNTLLHYLGTFAIQMLAITGLIILVARSRKRASGRNATFRQSFTAMFKAKKELYVTPIIIVLSAVPQTILTFSLSCSELSVWQRHVLLSAYLLSYAPQVLGFTLFVLPSKGYRMELQKTKLGQTSVLNWILGTKPTKHVPSTKT